MDFEEYEEGVVGTAIYPHRGDIGGLYYTAMGLAGEAGEFTGAVSKLMRDHKLEPKDRIIEWLEQGDDDIADDFVSHLVDELGDVLWFLTMAADELGWSLEEIAMANNAKLARRRANGTIGGSGDDR